MYAVAPGKSCSVSITTGNFQSPRDLLEYGCYMVEIKQIGPESELPEYKEILIDHRSTVFPNVMSLSTTLHTILFSPPVPPLVLVTLLNLIVYTLMGIALPHLIQMMARRYVLLKEISVMVKSTHPDLKALKIKDIGVTPKNIEDVVAEGAVGAGQMPSSLWKAFFYSLFVTISKSHWQANTGNQAVRLRDVVLSSGLGFYCLICVSLHISEGGMYRYIWELVRERTWNGEPQWKPEDEYENLIFQIESDKVMVWVMLDYYSIVFLFFTNVLIIFFDIIFYMLSWCSLESWKGQGRKVATTGIGKAGNAGGSSNKSFATAPNGPPVVHAGTDFAKALNVTVMYESESQPPPVEDDSKNFLKLASCFSTAGTYEDKTS